MAMSRGAWGPVGRGARPGGRLRVDELEDRAVPAGNVLAVQSGTFLALIGDDLGNEVMVRSGHAPDEVIVHGMDRTLVNGSNRDAVFVGVQQLVAVMRGGDDWFKATDLTLGAAVLGQLTVDGGGGDDRIELRNTEVHATHETSVQIFGERLFPGDPPSTGNDTIELTNTTIASAVGALNGTPVLVYGEENFGGEVTGGNDRISITGTEIRATGGLFETMTFLGVYGEFNQVFGPAGRIGQGNDSISVTNTTISAEGGEFRDSSFLEIYGDSNSVFGFDGGDGTAGVGGNDAIAVTNTTVSSVGGLFTASSALTVYGDYTQVGNASLAVGGNDAIAVTNTTVSATAGVFDDFSSVEIIGDYTTVSSFSEGAATVTGGGNDTITVDNAAVTAAGGTASNSAYLTIYGDISLAFGEVPGAARVELAGNDAIEVKNSRVAAAGAGEDYAAVEVFGEFGFNDSGLPLVAEGDDRVVLRHVRVSGDLAEVLIDTADGGDTLDVQNSSFHQFLASLGDGDDVAKFLANEFVEAHLDGGPGFDVLLEHGNVGLLTHSNFEDTRSP